MAKKYNDVFLSKKDTVLFDNEATDNSYNELRNQAADIRQNFQFQRKECLVFIQNENSPEFCMCGRDGDSHIKDVKQGAASDIWSEHFHVKSFPTNAFGEIHFAGTAENKTAPFIRISNDTQVKDLIRFAYKHWKLPQPKMIISITGGAGDLGMDKKLKEGLKRGLMKVAVSTGAWIVTGGINAGIMKLCGEAVHDYIEAHGEKDNSLVTIGVATWGIITNKQSLICQQGKDKFIAEYRQGKKEEKDSKRKVIECYLDPHHTHFILVDDGTENQFGKEMVVRAAFESEICKNDESLMGSSMGGSDENVGSDEVDSIKVPIVCVMVEGGPGTLQTAIEALKKETPLVIVEGSGRCADAIAYVYHKTKKRAIANVDQVNNYEEDYPIVDLQNDEEALVIAKACELLGVANDEKGLELYKKILHCVQHRHLLTVFKLDGRRTSTRDIDIAILRSLLSVSSNKFEQLKLALAWNRLDIAKSEIFADQSSTIAMKHLQSLMNQAILQAKVPFIQLFLEHGVILRDWLTPRILTDLYKKSFSKSGFLEKYLHQRMGKHGSDRFKLKMIGEVLRDFIGANYTSLHFNAEYADLVGPGATPDEKFADAARELFIYSLLTMKYEMMRFFWEEGTEQIAAGLFASTILRRMSQHHLVRNDVDQQEKLFNSANEYEELAIGILNQCQEDDDEQTQKILIREQRSFGKLTCIDLAVVADSKRFIAQTGCQSLLNSIWNGRMQPYNSRSTFVLALLFPPLIVTSIYFTNDTNPQEVAAGEEHTPVQTRHKFDIPKTASLIGNFDDNSTVNVGRSGIRLNWFERLSKFYGAPVTKFTLNFISYLAFLVLLSLFVLKEYPLNEITWFECLLCVWVFSFALEEFRQLLIEESEKMLKKMVGYVTKFWNILDLVALSLFSVGFILRLVALYWNPADRENDTRMKLIEWAHTSYVFSLIIYYVRLMHTCSVSQQLGPKVIMIAKMIQDLLFFLFILFVFLIAYGVALQALMYPNESSWNRIFQGIFYYPYWQMFGELFLEELGSKSDEVTNCDRILNGSIDKSLETRPSNTLYCESAKHVDVATHFLAVIYLFMTNIVLINLLIAMFSYTFEQVQEKTDLFWKFHLYELIKEYFQRPSLPPPFILIQHFSFFFRLLLSCCSSRVKPPNWNFKMKIQDSPLVHQLTKWEDVNAEEYMRDLDKEEKEKIEAHVKHTEANTERIIATLVDPMNEDESATVYDRISQIESKVDILGKQLDYINSVMQFIADGIPKGKGLPRKPVAPVDLFSSLPDAQSANSSIQTNASKPWNGKAAALPPINQDQNRNGVSASNDSCGKPAAAITTVHVKALTVNYYEVARIKVPTSLIPWHKVWYEYDPPSYTHPIVLEQPAWADLDFSNPKYEAEKRVVPWNKLDTLKKVDRRSYMTAYSLGKDDLLPRNPVGRTGLKGRGLLGRWGPNHAADPIVTRWKKDGQHFVTKKEKPVLEFVAIVRKDTGEVAIPGGMVDPGEEVSATLLREFLEEAVNYKTEETDALSMMNSEQKLRKIKELFFNNGTEIYRGYVDDPRNTDNAWMETVAVNFHDESGYLRNSQLQGGDDAKSAFWQQVSSEVKLYASHRDLIKKTAQLHNAYW